MSDNSDSGIKSKMTCAVRSAHYLPCQRILQHHTRTADVYLRRKAVKEMDIHQSHRVKSNFAAGGVEEKCLRLYC